MKLLRCLRFSGLRWLELICIGGLVSHGIVRCRHLKSLPGHDLITWDDFVCFMNRSYASLLPACEASRHYAKLKQTGSVKEFVREQVQVVHELDGTPYHPGGSVFDDFRNGLKPDVRKFVDDHAPTGWYTHIKDLYQKALRL